MLSSGPQLSWVQGLPPAKSGPGWATIDEDRDDRQSDTAIAATHRHTECSRGRHTSNTSTSLQLAVHAEPAASYPRHSHREHSTEGIHHHRYPTLNVCMSHSTSLQPVVHSTGSCQVTVSYQRVDSVSSLVHHHHHHQHQHHQQQQLVYEHPHDYLAVAPLDDITVI